VNTPNPVQPVQPAPVPTAATVWYKKPVYMIAMASIFASLTALYPKAAAVFHIDTPLGQAAAMELIGGLVTLLGGGILWLLTQFSKLHPVALTTATALTNPTTVALAQTQKRMDDAGIPHAAVLADQIRADQAGLAAVAKSS